MELNELSLRELQVECARALGTIEATNHNLSKFNKLANHNSQNWYKAVIASYVTEYGDLPSKIGPGKEIQLISDIKGINDVQV